MASKRTCGSCTLCCFLLPTAEIAKPGNERCPHQCSKGCRIYERRPMSCSLWNCRWLVDDDTGDQLRPDRSRLVIDMLPDVLKITDDGVERTVPCIVAWIDPASPDAWRHAAFQRYAMRQTVPILLRLSSEESVGVLFPPACSGQPGLMLKESRLGQDMPTTLQEKAAAIGGTVDLPGEDQFVGKATLRFADGRTVEIASNWREPL